MLTAKSLTPEETTRLQESVTRVIHKQGLEGEKLIQALQRAMKQWTG